MFTGLVQDLGTIDRVAAGGMTDLWIRSSLGAQGGYVLGESIAVDGTCLTVVEFGADWFKVQAGSETLRRTTVGELSKGARVNLERAMRLGDRLGGHIVQGHVDAVGEVLGRANEGDSLIVTFSLPDALRPFFIEKGSVTVDGVSLTVATLGSDRFSVMLIPETQRQTTLGQKRPGDRVNLEADLIGKYVARLFSLGQAPQGNQGGVSLELLRAAGFASRSE